MFHSLRARLFFILVLLVAAATASGVIMFALFEQSTTAQIGQAAALAGRACDGIGRAYRFYTTGWQGAPPDLTDAKVQRDLSAVTFTALREKTNIEGGLWNAETGAFAYAFPSYQGSGPKTDIPQAELPRIVDTSLMAQKEDRPQLTRIDSGSQTLLITACPLPGPIVHLSAWTMTRIHSLAGKTYWQLMSGLAILVLSVGMASVMAVGLIMTWSRHVAGIVEALAAPSGDELPTLKPTGERELDYIVKALNDMREKLIVSRRQTEVLARQVSTGERLAAVGRVTAGVAHEFRNPLAAMRLRAEVALRGKPERKDQALELVMTQIDRLDDVIRRLLKATEREPLRRENVALRPFLAACVADYRSLALSKGVALRSVCETATGWFDPDPMRRAVGNLIHNALQENAPKTVVVRALLDNGDLVFEVADQGAGPPDDIRDHLFDPFVSGSPDRAGLGLAIVHEIASAHDGRAEFRQENGQTIFRIVSPCPAS